VNAPGPKHTAIRGTESGCLAIADISGYTAYLGSAELAHAQDVLEDLTETVVRALSPPISRHSEGQGSGWITVAGVGACLLSLLPTSHAVLARICSLVVGS
jgi:hypothetical protein